MEKGMLAWLRYRFQLSRLQMRRRIALKKLKTAVHFEEDHKTFITLNEAIYILMTDYLIETAEKLMIETPHPSPPEWKESDTHTRVYLGEPAIFKLRALIRSERKERSELVRSW